MPVRYQIDGDISSRIIDGEAVILRIKETTYFSLNPVGTLIWTLMDEKPRTRDELIENVCKRYDIDPVTAGADVDELLVDLTEQKLVVVLDK